VQIARDIERRLSTYVRDPVVTVIVSGFVGPFSEQIRVVGEAARPQSLPYRQKMTLLDLMIVVGGLTDFADGNAAIILRTSEDNKQYSVRLRDLIRRGDVSANVEMKPGDILIIPQSYF
jgi:polysaccharide export outer membrane protein